MPFSHDTIAHRIHRRIEPRWFIRVERPFPLLNDFIDPPAFAYGRIGTIFFDEAPAIEVCEVVTDQKGGV